MQAIVDTITYYFNQLIEFLKSIFDFFITLITAPDLIALAIFKKIMAAIVWLFDWASASCSYCMSGAGSLPYQIQSAYTSLAGNEYGNIILYCINKSGVPDCMKILTCGIIMWSVFKIISFIKGIIT